MSLQRKVQIIDFIVWNLPDMTQTVQSCCITSPSNRMYFIKLPLTEMWISTILSLTNNLSFDVASTAIESLSRKDIFKLYNKSEDINKNEWVNLCTNYNTFFRGLTSVTHLDLRNKKYVVNRQKSEQNGANKIVPTKKHE